MTRGLALLPDTDLDWYADRSLRRTRQFFAQCLGGGVVAHLLREACCSNVSQIPSIETPGGKAT